MYTLSGLAVSAGITLGQALVIAKAKTEYTHEELFSYDPDAEEQRFLKKTAQFSQKLHQIVNPDRDSVRDLLGAASGYLCSAENKNEIIELIKKGCSASMAAKTVLLGNLQNFKHSDDALEENKKALEDLIFEFIHTLEHSVNEEDQLPDISSEVVLIAKDLTPAQFLSLNTSNIKGVILEGGRDSGHLGVVLRELEIPAIYGVFGATSIKNGTNILIDGNASILVVDPPEDTAYGMMSRQDLAQDQLNDESLLNITIASAVGAIGQNTTSNRHLQKHGLGLLRSEFLFLSSLTEPTEEEMLEQFARIFDPISKDSPITARTFDFADDKKPLFNLHLDESGPLKGYGAYVGTSLLKKEIRALLRATAGKKLTIVFPLVTKISEKDYLIDLAHTCQKELTDEGEKIGQLQLSFMIETPAAVLLAPAIVKGGRDCSMMIIGTSSLAEYASAPCPADRAFTPVLAKMIVMAAKAAYDAGVTLGMAGRFASRPELIPFFFKLGVTYLVAGSYNIEKLRNVIERLNLEKDITPQFDMELYNKVMNCYTGSELNEILK